MLIFEEMKTDIQWNISNEFVKTIIRLIEGMKYI
jgi:hypothetical protein